MIVLSAERFETFKKCISLCVHGKVGVLEFICLSETGNTSRIVQVRKERTNETVSAEVSVMSKKRIIFHDREKQKIAIELRPTKMSPNCKLFCNIKFYKNNDLTD